MIIKKNLDSVADDKRVLKNPHKGWYWHFVDNGMRNGLYRDKTPDGETYKTFPGLNHLYLRLDWADIQPDSPDEFNWNEVDEIMDKWGKLGYKFSFRICCNECDESMCFATPKWLYEMGCKGMFYPPTPEECPEWYEYDESIGRIVDPNDPNTKFHLVWEPDYGDELFLKYLDKFLENFAAKFDNDPRVEFVDLGSYGNWGEGHVYHTSKKSAPLEVLKKHAYLHKKHFKNKLVLMNDDYISCLNHYTSEERQELYDFCMSLGLGIRDDSIMVSYYRKRYHALKEAELFDRMYENGPVDIEFAHMKTYTRNISKDGLGIVEAIKRTRATFCGFHTYPEDWLKEYYHLTEYLANRLGYWYIINTVSHNGTMYKSAPCAFVFELENMGFAKAYYKYRLILSLVNKNTGEKYEFENPDFDNRLIEGGEKSDVKIFGELDEKASEGIYLVNIKMLEGNSVIELALKESIKNEDGSYTVSEVELKNI